MDRADTYHGEFLGAVSSIQRFPVQRSEDYQADLL